MLATDTSFCGAAGQAIQPLTTQYRGHCHLKRDCMVVTVVMSVKAYMLVCTADVHSI